MKGTCGRCGVVTMTGAICATHWRDLIMLMDRAYGIAVDLESPWPVRTGEERRVRGRVGLPLSVQRMEARRGLAAALRAARAEILPGLPRLVIRDEIRMLRAHEARLRGSWVAPVLLGELERWVPAAVAACDRPRGRMEVPAVCPACGRRARLRMVAGAALECPQCGGVSAAADVRRVS